MKLVKTTVLRRIAILLAAVCVVSAAVAVFWGISELQSRDAEWIQSLSALGSFFSGTVGSLFALAAWLFIVVNFIDQQTQLAKQEESLKLQDEALKRQEAAITRQNFEHAFFQLLALHNQITTTAKIGSGGQYVGRDCFTVWHRQLYKTHVNTATPVTDDVHYSAKCYKLVYDTAKTELAHYFRNLYHIFKFISDARIPEDSKRQYSSIARAQLSAYELALLFYNGIMPIEPDGTNKFKQLIERFGLFNNLDKNLLMHPFHEKYYNESAFK